MGYSGITGGVDIRDRRPTRATGSLNRMGNSRYEDLAGAVVVYDIAGKVVEANRAACTLLGVSLEDLLGSAAEDSGWLVTEGSEGPIVDNTHPALAALRSRKPEQGILVRAKRANGRHIWIQVDAVPTLSTAGEASSVLVSLTDVTRILSHSGLSDRSVGDHIVAAITTQLANTHLDPQAILSAVTTTLSKMRSGTWVAALMNKDPSTTRIVAANDSDPEVAHYIEDMHLSGGVSATSISMRVIETGQPVFMPTTPFDEFIGLLTPGVRNYLTRNPPPTADQIRYLGVVVVPMRARDATVGTLGLFERRSSNPFTAKDINWVQAVADRTGLAIDNAQLYQDAVSRLNRLDSLRSVGLAISSSPDLRLTLQVIVDQATAHLAVDAADVLLLDETAGLLALTASAGFRSTSMPDYRLPVDEGLPGGVVVGRRIETVTALSAFSQSRRRSLFAREGFRTYGAVPLIARSRLRGVLEVFHRSPLQPDPEWQTFLEALASEAAIAIDNAAMHEHLQNANATERQSKTAAPVPNLSQVERQILALMVEGGTNREIASQVHLSQNTIKFHVRQILQKTGTGNRTELARLATREGWL